MRSGDAIETILSVWRAEPAHVHVEALTRELGRPVYLVGGAVRDALLGHRVEDWDLATTDARRLAEDLAHRTHGRFVSLHEEIPSFRIVLDRDNPDYCLDVSELRDPEIKRDLSARDLTINALAFEVLTHQLFDPLGGLRDLQEGVLRATSHEALQYDALRCLRVYRLHSELGSEIEPQTRGWLRETAPLAPKMPGERLGVELLKTLRPGRATATLRLMDEDGLLGHLLPEIEPARGVEQGRYHHLDVWGHTLDAVEQLEDILLRPGEYFRRTHREVERYVEQRRLAPVLLLTALLHDLGKPAMRTQDERGWWRFYEHDRVGAEMARRIARRFRLRRRHLEVMSLLIRHHLRPMLLANMQAPQDGRPPQEITRHALVRMFRAVQPHGIGLLLLALADARACRGPATAPGFHERLAEVLDEMLERFLDWQRERQSGPLLTGKDLIQAGYPPGKRMGEVLEAVEEAHVEDLVGTKAEALALAKRLFSS